MFQVIYEYQQPWPKEGGLDLDMRVLAHDLMNKVSAVQKGRTHVYFDYASA